MFAAIIIAIAPTVVVYSLFSNQIVEGLTTGAVKDDMQPENSHSLYNVTCYLWVTNLIWLNVLQSP